MKWVWTWGGKSVGYLDGDDLWTQEGKHVGKLSGEEIYAPDGKYLGEVKSDNRLITNRAKSGWRRSNFSPYGRRVGHVPHVNYVGYVMYAGYEDFPLPDSF
jgi:hypothetical protein